MASDQGIKLLADILRTLERIEKKLGNGAASNAAGAVASDRDLDSQYGNPKVPLNPRDWHGASFKGRQLSECPAEFLDLLAETFDYFAKKAEEKDERTSGGKPVADYKRKDAARARAASTRAACPSSRATRVADGNTSLVDCPMLT